MLVQPASAGGNFEYIALPRQGLLFLSGALGQWSGRYAYDRQIWFEDRCGLLDPGPDLEGVDVLMVSALINEVPRAYQIARQAKEAHPGIITIGGGPHMGPLAEEAFREGGFDVVVQREGEGIIGHLCDVLLEHHGKGTLAEHLRLIPGISFPEDGAVQATKRVGLIAPDFVPLPDFRAIRGLSKSTPLATGVIETVRGCTEKCTYCQVIQQFLGYRMVSRETEIARLRQLRELADEGLIFSGRGGMINVFVSDDLHPPPLRATKFRDERLARLRGWKESGLTEGMNFTCQARVEIAQDPELYEAMYDASFRMLYLGVESDNAENLKAVNKRQEAGQMHQDLLTLGQRGFSVVAMTIIGLPFDTEESIMALADWVTEVSRFQTANLLFPLPATSNWTDLEPLAEDGSPLPPGGMRPYHLYTGRQFVHRDDRWTMQQSRELFDRYAARLNSIDSVYAQALRFLRRRKRAYPMRLAVTSPELGSGIGARVGKAIRVLRDWDAPSGGDDTLARRVAELADALTAASQPLSNAPPEVAEDIGRRLETVAESLQDMADPRRARPSLVDPLSRRVLDLSERLERVASGTPRPH